jgi:hypothetical protein
MPPLRDEAEALACALEIGAVDVDAVIDWADAQIAEDPTPHWVLCEAATSRGKYPQDVASELRQIPGRTDPVNVRSLLVQLMAGKLKKNEGRAYQLASALYQMAYANEVEQPELRALAWWAWDALDLADCGHIAETRAQVVERMRDVLERAAEEAAQRGPAWTGTWTPV